MQVLFDDQPSICDFENNNLIKIIVEYLENGRERPALVASEILISQAEFDQPFIEQFICLLQKWGQSEKIIENMQATNEFSKINITNLKQFCFDHINGTEIKRNFQLYVMPMLRASSRSVEIFLNLHPNIFIAPRMKVDHALANGTWAGISSEAQIFNEAQRNFKCGIVSHAHPVYTRDYFAITSKMERSAQFFQIVRDPIDAVYSHVNHALQVKAHGYTFENLNLPWLNGTEISDFSAQKIDSINLGSPPSIDIEQEIFNGSSTPAIKYYQGAFRYEDFFGHWNVLSTEDLPQDKGTNDLNVIFNSLSLSEEIELPDISFERHGKAVRFMYNNPFKAFIFGQQVNVIFIPTGGAEAFLDTRTSDGALARFTEVADIGPNDLMAGVGITNCRISLGIEANDWIALPSKIRRTLIEENIFKKFLENVALPRFVANFKAILMWMRNIDVKPFEKAQIDGIRSIIEPDLKRFLTRHPHVQKSWKNGNLY
jgi:hypothetical protein